MHMHRRIVELTLRNTIVAIEEVSDVANCMLIIVGNLHTSLQASFKFRRSQSISTCGEPFRVADLQFEPRFGSTLLGFT
jgi:hypothetical protein